MNAPAPKPPIDGVVKQALETGRNRLLVGGVLFAVAFAAIGFRLADVAVVQPQTEPRIVQSHEPLRYAAERADIVDRNGTVLATSLRTASLYANPREVPNAREAAERLSAILPELRQSEIVTKLDNNRSFVWLRRHLTPDQQFAVNNLGIPGLHFRKEERRIYPQGSLFAHVLGFAGVDGVGLAGIEKSFDDTLRASRDPLMLSLDARVQHALHQELTAAIANFRAIGGTGLVMDVRNGEVIAMVSLPDFDPNHPGLAPSGTPFNRASLGVFEMGSTFKIFTTAMAIDSGRIAMGDSFDASAPIRVARHTISDFRGQNRWLNVPEIFIHSSNIGSARMALLLGTETQQAYLDRFGLTRPATIELPEIGAPILPSPWREITTMTVSYGHGIAVSPLQLSQAVAAAVNGGVLYPSTLLKALPGERPRGTRVIAESTSDQMRRLMRLVVHGGTGQNAYAEGYVVGGKTGTSEKIGPGGYNRNRLMSSFVGAFPMHDPRYVVLAVIDEPHGNPSTFGFATGGWVAAPVVGAVIRRSAPLLGVLPVNEADPGLNAALNLEIPPATPRQKARDLASF